MAGRWAAVVGLVVALGGLGGGCRPAESQESAQGKALFQSVCARCHGREGRGGVAQGSAPAPRDFTDATFQRTRTDAQIRETIVHGRAGGAMPPFGTAFTAEELDALVQQVRAFGAPEERR